MKGQITAFVILGLVAILLFFAGWAYYQSTIEPLDTEIVGKIIVPDDGKSMHEYTTACLEAVGKRGIKILGSSGGYIYQDFKINFADNTEAEAVQFSPGSDLLIPYWYHMKDPNQCVGKCRFESLRPPITGASPLAMENQLENYIESNLANCLEGYQAFVEAGYTFEAEIPTADVTISDETVMILLDMPITFKRGEKEISLDQFGTVQTVKLGKLYKLGTALTQMQANHSYLEKHMKNLIDMYGGMSEDRLPPTSNVVFDYDTGIMWIRDSVENNIQLLLVSYTPLLQVFATSNYEPIQAPGEITDAELFDKLYNRNMLVFTGDKQTYNDLEASFSYIPWWGMYFYLNCDGQLCKPEPMYNSILPQTPFGIQRYQFSYDVSAPFLVELNDPYAFSGEGYSFRFFLEGNLRNNEPMPSDGFNPVIMHQSGLSTMLCDQDKKNGAETYVEIRDAKTTELVQDADLTYICGEEACHLGKSITGMSEVQLPVCYGGLLSTEKDDYITAYSVLDSDPGLEETRLMVMEPIQKVDIKVSKYKLIKNSGKWQLNQNKLPLGPNDEVFITLQRTDETLGDQFSAFASVFGNNKIDLLEGYNTNIDMVPGNFELEITNLYKPEKPLKILPYEMCIKGFSCVKIPEEEIIFDFGNPLPSGGVRTNILITPDMLEDGILELSTISLALEDVPEKDRRIEDLDEVSNLPELSSKYSKLLVPQ